MEFSSKERKILKRYFTTADSGIFCLTNMPEVVKGTLFSRYSRSDKSVRRLFLDEFYDNDIEEGKAEEFYERVLLGYGDDSVAELGGVHIALEGISNIMAKLVEDARIGISPLEKSTRYVYFDKKDAKGNYLYYRPEAILKSKFGKEYIAVMDMLFDTYSHIVRTIVKELLKEKPPKNISPIAFKASCRAKACDVARYMLPMATRANVGLYGNGRAFEYLLIKLQSSPYPEAHELAVAMTEELRKVIPAFVKRAGNDRGKMYAAYLETIREEMTEAATMQHKPIEGKTENEVQLIDWNEDAEERVIAALLYPYATVSYDEVRTVVKKMSKKDREALLAKVTGARANRHHKSPRGFENAHYTVEVLSDIGAFRDVHRHRMLTQQRQAYTTDLGYTVPAELDAFPKLKKAYVDALDTAKALYEKMRKTMPFEAQYVVPFAYRIRYSFHMNLREAQHFTELRSIPQGHSSYRKIAQAVAKAIMEKHPLLGKYAFGFVDYNSYALERLQTFQKIVEKAQKKGVKVFED